ncbi:LLM class flavin-dependent oxidoreductase [Roseomonas elaeocarpi]|uniref:LLM class flavin-dependent oxidoreductase n=1 Tax=Roseomonas elaeocarpi TaxID=907779 RepID=A0ABV6JPV5_9PROT
MRLGYFAMPMHPAERPWRDTLREDREAVILADRLGFHDAFIGEHLTDRVEAITNSLLFLATLISDTRQIRLATGTTNLSQIHPAIVAAQAAMFDHLADGRFILGISPGALKTDAEVLGILDEDRNRIFAEAIDVILQIWERDPPYDIDLPNNRFKVSTARSGQLHLGVGVLPKPFQQPRPEIVGTVVAPFSKGVIAMGARDFHPLSANFLLPKWARTHWSGYAQGKASVGLAADPSDWRVARSIFVADDDRTADRYGGGDANSPYRFYHRQIRSKFAISGRLAVFKEHPNMDDDAVTDDYVLDRLMISGSINRVVDEILRMREEIGDFGELVYAGMDWVDPQLGRRSMQLMAEEVMPRVNAAIGRGATAAPLAATA